MARVESASTDPLETIVKSPLEVSISKHALKRLDAYANEAQRYYQIIRGLVSIDQPVFQTPFVDEIAIDVAKARKNS